MNKFPSNHKNYQIMRGDMKSNQAIFLGDQLLEKTAFL